MFVWMTCYFVVLLLVCCLLFALGVGLDCFDCCYVADFWYGFDDCCVYVYLTWSLICRCNCLSINSVAGLLDCVVDSLFGNSFVL